MDTSLGTALSSTSTSNQWFLMSAVAAKVSRKLPVGESVDAQTLDTFLTSISPSVLKQHGIWFDKQGNAGIVCINPAYGRARQGEENPKCTCVSRGDGDGDDDGRFFGSTAYNAGRHNAGTTQHGPKCYLWAPATAGHLHSWRRGYE